MKKEILILFILVVLLLVACTSNSNITAPNKIQTNNVSNANVKEFTIHGSSFKFDPSEIRVNKGDHVKINFISDDVGHNLIIDELNIKTKVLSSGEEQSVEFTADKEGIFNIVCTVGNHKQLGMEGQLIVEA